MHLTRSQAVYLLLILPLPLLVLLALFSIDRSIPSDSPYWLRQASLAGPTTASRVTLPWLGAGGAPNGVGINKAVALLTFDASLAKSADPSQPWALLLPRPLSAFSIELNGTALAQRGRMTVPASWLRWPVLIEIPPDLLHDGRNVLRITTVRQTSTAHVPALLVGPSSVLLPMFKQLRLFAVTVPLVLMIATIGLGLLVLGLFFLRPADTAYGWFGLCLLLWSAHIAHDQIEHLPIENRDVWFALSYLTLGWFVAVATVFVHRLLLLRPAGLERALWLLMTAGSGLLLALALECGNCFLLMAQAAWVPLILANGLYLVIRLLLHSLRNPRTELMWLLPAAWIASAVGVRDYLWEIDVLPWGSTYYLVYASAIVLGVFAVIMLKRFASALRETEELNAELEQRVAAKAQQLERNYQTLRLVENQRERLAERELIMRDMHDSLGGNLVQALAIMDRDAEASEARVAVGRCLDDLRMILDSSGLDGGDILPLIAAFRHRMERGLRRVGIELTLVIEEMTACASLDRAESMHLLRILQEAINNVVKHAKARRIEMRLGVCMTPAPTVQVDIRDDGIGMKASRTTSGRGLSNMRWRASEMGAQLTHQAADPGTRVRLRIPLIRSSAAPQDQA